MKDTKKSEKWTWDGREYLYEIGKSSWNVKDFSIRMRMDDKKGYKQSSPEVPIYAVEDFVKICADEQYFKTLTKWRIIKALVKSFFTNNKKKQRIRFEYSNKGK